MEVSPYNSESRSSFTERRRSSQMFRGVHSKSVKISAESQLLTSSIMKFEEKIRQTLAYISIPLFNTGHRSKKFVQIVRARIRTRDLSLNEPRLKFISRPPTSNAPLAFHCQLETMEPLTLSEGQLQEAREAAVDIIRKKQPDEALIIFTKGLRPVRSMREMQCLLQSEPPQLHNLIENPHAICSFSSVEEDNHPCLHRLDTVRGPSSAPF